MSYKIDWQSNNAEGIPGKTPIVLPTKTLNSTASSLTLTGKGVNNYGEIQQENFLRLMENFASGTPPQNPTIGQLWFNTVETILYIKVDPALAAPFHPLYFPQSPASWMQIWPDAGGSNTYAGLSEYNTLAISVNRILGVPSIYGSNSDAALTQWGWGQSDLVPVYTNINTLAPGFSAAMYPPTFDNNAWVILLSRVRKALRHIGAAESTVSTVGFINDKRPTAPGNALANAYNNNPAAGVLSNYTSGWGNFGVATMATNYAATISAIDNLIANRFTASASSIEMSVLGSVSRSTPWTSSVSHSATMTFANYDSARSYFNSGGIFVFNFALNSPGGNLLSTSWSSFLSNQSNLIFDFKGLRHGTVYYNAPSSSVSRGFYDLTTTSQSLFDAKRNFISTSGAYATVDDGGLRISAFLIFNENGTVTINFSIVFDEAPYPGESVTGTLVSSQTAKKANSINVNAPLTAYPVWTGSAITDVSPVPAQGLPEGTG